jgi:deoxyadenosine/deoxycytidine kinase
MSVLLSIEGPIGVGKTSLTGILADELKLRGVYELSFRNPYLGRFYSDIERYSFPIQIEFLVNRFRQWKKIQDAEGDVVCDYFFYKDEIFAEMNLKGEDIKLYRRIYNFMVEHIKPPRYVIYLSASPEVLMERIRKRGRDYESPIKYEYISRLCRYYREYMNRYTLSPVLKVDTETLDYVNRTDDREFILSEIRRFLNTYG